MFNRMVRKSFWQNFVKKIKTHGSVWEITKFLLHWLINNFGMTTEKGEITEFQPLLYSATLVMLIDNNIAKIGRNQESDLGKYENHEGLVLQ